MTTSVPTRLHITPLNASLLPTVLGPHLTKVAENISFQTVDNFPENNYGFVDLPETEAKTLVTKLNGAILKGRKMKVEKARAKKRSHDAVQQDTAAEQEKSQRKSKKSKKDKDAENGVLEGYQLPADRKVKRGWTEPKSDERTRHKAKSKDKEKTKKSKRQAPSQYTEKEELLFRTELPPNKQYLDQDSKSKSRNKSKSKDKQKSNTETVVHEFQRTEIQPAFVRDTASSGRAAEYIDNVGWVDENGHVVETAASSSSRKNPTSAESRRIAVPKSDGAKISDMQDEHAETASSGSSSSSAIDDEDVDNVQEIDATSDSASTSSASRVDPDSESDKDHEEDGQEARSAPHSDEQVGLETPQKVHPLEALFKRPHPPAGQEAAKPSLEIETSFSFFDQSAADADADADDDLPPMPATPFTSNDMRSRGVRSAAPTPDTAHPSRFTGFAGLMATRLSREQSVEDGKLNTVGNDQILPASENSDRAQSDFEKRFWAERGQNNRAWKSRRKTALKEQRQKENRLRRPRNW